MARQRLWILGAWRGRDQALLKAAAEWRQTFDAIDCPILVLDPNGRITRLNRAAQTLVGLDFRDLLGRPIESVASAQPWPTIAEVARTARAKGTGISRQVRDEVGTTWHVSASCAAGASKEAGRIIALARDVSAVVSLEASLRRFEAMAALGTLVSGVAHEVRNPLFAISATVDALEARATGREDLGPFLETLRGELDRLSRLMRDLLEYGKPLALELVETDIGDVLSEALHAFAAAAAERGVGLRSMIEPGLAQLRVDRGRVAQVLHNLVENALQHSPRGAEVELYGAIAVRDGYRRVQISVSDRGPGFPPADFARVFEPFFTRRQGGTGLGLAIVKRLVEAHGGSVEARNRPRGGAIVSFSFPLPYMAGAVPADTPPSSPSHA